MYIKETIIREILEIENVDKKLTQCPLINKEKLILTLSKDKYKLGEELGIGTATATSYIKKLFPDRPTGLNTKIDNWLLSKYGYKQCKSCSFVKEIEEFSSNSSRPDGLNTYCKICHNENTREYQREYQMRYKALKKSRIPKWANIKAIQEIYNNCPEGMEVDHIVPLQGLIVSGLHVENNLQYLTKEQNCSKRNKFTGV